MKTAATVRFIPLGGLGEIGMNCFALEQSGSLLVVDCGAGFPDDDVGVDVVVPDFDFLIENEARIVGIFITHGHEDHIGALPYLLRELDRIPPIFAPPHAKKLIEQRLVEHELSDVEITVVRAAEKVELGPFSIEPVPVAHSIVDAMALSIETGAGRIIHTGDFDIDEVQPAGHPTDGRRFEELGRQGVRLLLSDSTNVDTEIRAGSEERVGEALSRIVGESSERVVIALFASNVHRLKLLGEIARETGRRICFLGRSLSKQYEAATAIGRLAYPSNLLVAPEAVAALPRREVLVLAGGSQGEASSALRRLSLETHQNLKLEAGDTVVFSSRIIPGNERVVFGMMNDLLRLGVDVRNRVSDPDVHTSGHAARSEQRQMIHWTVPSAFVPVHGTLHHLRKHAELARAEGVSDTMVIENGATILVPPEGPLELGPRVRAGLTRIAYGGEELDVTTRKRRLDLARGGVAIVTVGIDQKRRIIAGPTFSTYGIPTVDGDKGASKVITSEVLSVVRDDGKTGLPLEEAIRRAVRRTLQDWTGTRPVVEVHVARADAAR